MEEKTGMVKVYIRGDKVVKVEGADTIPIVEGPIVDISVLSQEKSLNSGCPAYIIINGRKYRI